MKNLFGKILKASVYLVFLMAFVWVSAQLFFERETNDLMASVKDKFTSNELNGVREELTIAYAFAPASLDPNVMDFNSRKVMVNMYESLVALDRDLNPRPSLAVSWGLVDDETTWEFNLRKGVKFHDGSEFNVSDVVASFERALNMEGSEVKDFLNTVESFEAEGAYKFVIRTYEADPLLLQKIANVLIIPEELAGQEVLSMPIGTAPYKLVSQSEDGTLGFAPFLNHWRGRPSYKKVELIYRSDLVSRVNELLSGNAAFLADVPFVAVDKLLSEGLELDRLPSLEVQFLLFNFNSDSFDDLDNRRAFSLAIDQDSFVGLVGEYARSVNQYVSNGVFGFNPQIEMHHYDLEEAKVLAEESGLEGKTIHFHLPIGLDILGEHVRTQLAKIGVNVIVSYLEVPDLMESIDEKRADVYFFGFKTDTGDSSYFFNTVARTGADFNVGSYSDSGVDELIDKSLITMNEGDRLELLQDLMEIVSVRDLIGVPLFEYDTLYSYASDLDFDPRIDGVIYFDDIKAKQ